MFFPKVEGQSIPFQFLKLPDTSINHYAQFVFKKLLQIILVLKCSLHNISWFAPLCRLASLEDKHSLCNNLTSSGESSIQQYVRIFSSGTCHITTPSNYAWLRVFKICLWNENASTESRNCCKSQIPEERECSLNKSAL